MLTFWRSNSGKFTALNENPMRKCDLGKVLHPKGNQKMLTHLTQGTGTTPVPQDGNKAIRNGFPIGGGGGLSLKGKERSALTS